MDGPALYVHGGHLGHQHVYSVLRLRELAHILGDLARLDARKCDALFVADCVAIADWLQEEGDVVRAALGPDALDEGRDPQTYGIGIKGTANFGRQCLLARRFAETALPPSNRH